MTEKKPYFPNNWKRYKDSPDEMFVEHTYEELMDWKIGGWELPESVCALIRVTDVNTKQITEYSYQRKDAAEKRVGALLEKGGVELVIATQDKIAFITPEDYEDDYNE